MADNELSSKERFLAVLNGKIPDRLPVTTHHVMPYFLNKHMNGISNDEFFDYFGLDPINWVVAGKPDTENGEYYDPDYREPGFLESRRIISDNWRIESEELGGYDYATTRYKIITPKKTLTAILQSNDQTTWIYEHLVKEKSDVDIIGEYVIPAMCDVDAVNRAADEYGDKGMVRGHIRCFDIFGQPGCWQDASCLFGIEKLIMATYDDPEWVHTFLKALLDQKMKYVKSMKGARYDLIELGGGDASTTVISPGLFDEFVAPYDSMLIKEAHEAGQKVVYHTCGGMMPILENIAGMNPDAMETFTPPAMGADVILSEAKKRIGDKVCIIGGFDQFHYFTGCTPVDTRKAVRKYFEDAGEGGGFILCPSDHFFDADLDLVKAYADEARKCVYK